MKIPCTGVILAGGLNSRFSGTNKAFIRIGKNRILDNIYNIFKDLFEEIILVTNDPVQYAEWDALIVTDVFPVRSSLTGIHAGLFYTSNPFAFFTACDTPFLKKELVEMLVNGINPDLDIVIPETSAGLEPLCAVYSKYCIVPAERNLMRQNFKIQKFFRKLRVKKVPENTLRGKDPNLISFFNINTPDDLAKAEKLTNKP